MKKQKIEQKKVTTCLIFFFSLLVLFLLIVCQKSFNKITTELDDHKKIREVFEDLAKESDIIFKGLLISKKAKWCKSEKIAYTYFEFEVNEKYKGNIEKNVIIKYPGIQPDINVFEIIDLPDQDVIVKTDSGTPSIEEQKSFYIFGKLKNPHINEIRFIDIFFEKENKLIYEGGIKLKRSDLIKVIKK